jgi:hypothetical protein
MTASAAAIADINPIGCSVDANIVSVAIKLNLTFRLVLVSFEQSHRTVAGVGDIKHVRGKVVADALRLLQPRDCLQQLAIGEIDDTNAVVAQFGYEQPLSFQIDRHVVNPPVHIAKGDLGF